MKLTRIFLWSLCIASIGGIYGLVSLDFPMFALYSMTPPPLLGQPFGYQTLPTCNSQTVCPPVVQNSFAVASTDFAICFSITFLIISALLLAFRHNLLASTSIWKRNALPASLMVIVMLIVSVATSGSVSSGASLSQPHWAPGVMDEYILNITVSSGTPSSETSQGTARMNLILASDYWTNQNVSVSVTVRGSNSSAIPVSLYQCPNPQTCDLEPIPKLFFGRLSDSKRIELDLDSSPLSFRTLQGAS